MPGALADGKRVAAVGRESHLGAALQLTVWQSLVEHSADMGDRVVRRQIELHRDRLPMRVAMDRYLISRRISGQDRGRILAEPGVARAEASSKRRRQPLDEGPLSSFERRARPTWR